MEKLISWVSSNWTIIFWGTAGMALDYWVVTTVALLFLLLGAIRIMLREWQSLKRST